MKFSVREPENRAPEPMLARALGRGHEVAVEPVDAQPRAELLGTARRPKGRAAPSMSEPP